MSLTSPKRYIPAGTRTDKYVPSMMWEQTEGDWVKWEDYEALRKGALEAIKMMIDTHGIHGPCNHHDCEGCRLAHTKAKAFLDAQKGM
jgi:hypothetical protein